MYKPNEDNFDLQNIKKNDLNNFKITRSIDIECDTLENQLNIINIDKLDYLKIDTQGAELEILKGLGDYRPLLMKIEAHFFSMYENVPSWNQLVSYLYELNYTLIDFKGIGNHSTRIPAEADMIFIPNFNNENGKEIIKSREKFMLNVDFWSNKTGNNFKKINIADDELMQLEDNISINGYIRLFSIF